MSEGSIDPKDVVCTNCGYETVLYREYAGTVAFGLELTPCPHCGRDTDVSSEKEIDQYLEQLESDSGESSVHYLVPKAEAEL